MKNIAKNYTVKELLEMVADGRIIRESLQRTPSHDEKKAKEILTSLKSGKYCGVLHFAKIGENENKQPILSCLDGSSRLKDLENYKNGKIFFIKKVTETKIENGTTTTINKKINETYNDLLEKEKADFDNYVFNCIILEDLEEAGRCETFRNINNSTALSTIQKNKGNVSADLQNIIDLVANSKILLRIFTPRQMQKDEHIMLTYTTLANIYGVYTASNKKLTDEVNKLDLSTFNFDRFSLILSKFDSIDTNTNKYCLISLLTQLYCSDILTMEKLENTENFNNTVVWTPDTAGANSENENGKRLDKAKDKLNQFYGFSILNGQTIKKAETKVEKVNISEMAK